MTTEMDDRAHWNQEKCARLRDRRDRAELEREHLWLLQTGLVDIIT